MLIDNEIFCNALVFSLIYYPNSSTGISPQLDLQFIETVPINPIHTSFVYSDLGLIFFDIRTSLYTKIPRPKQLRIVTSLDGVNLNRSN